MKKICIAIPLLMCLTACTTISPTPTTPPAAFVTLGVPLNSEAGQIKLIVIEYLSETMAKNDPQIRFVPLTDVEIQQVRAHFRHTLRSGAQADYISGRGLISKSTGETGLAIELQDAQLNGDVANVEAGFYTRAGESRYDFRLAKIGQQWRIHDITPVSTSDLAIPKPIYPSAPPRRDF